MFIFNTYFTFIVIEKLVYYSFVVLTWINFLTFLFWLSTCMFLLNSKNLITVILYSEIVWVILYCYTTITGTINDDLILTSTSFFLLALAGLEFCIGFIIAIFYKNFKKSFDLDSFTNFSKNGNTKQFNSNRYIWKYTNII
jgi:NADH:ubiquinone oxidoreductase subunit K